MKPYYENSDRHLLRVENLTVALTNNHSNNHSDQTILQDIHFEIALGKTLCLLGESGAGKSLTGLSLLQLLPSNALFSKSSKIFFDNRDLLLLPEAKVRKLRGGKIAMIFQEPMTSFNPILTVGEQILEAVKLHQHLYGKKAKLEVIKLLDKVELKESKRIFSSYPHQLSGGQKQRAMIAMGLAGKPKLLILDEPTSALDVTVQAQILNLLQALQRESDLSMLFITHDLWVAKKMAHQVAILKAGKIVEQGLASAVFENPQAGYTQQLIKAAEIPLKPKTQPQPEVLLKLDKVSVSFPIKEGLFRRTVSYVKAVDEISFELLKGETLGVVGESGSGKSTLAKAILALIPLHQGNIYLKGENLQTLNKNALRKMRKYFQIIFQDPFGALDPRSRVKEILEEGILALNLESSRKKRLQWLDQLLEQVGLSAAHKTRYPHEFSGGERQRLCIARALSVRPSLIVCDEPTSSLDMTIQAQIIDLLINLQQEFQLSYVFISHNIKLVQAIAHKITVMKEGRIVEYGLTTDIIQRPMHPYTQRLLKALF